MESSGACNLKGAVSREAAIAAPIIKLLWSPARESEAERRGGGREGREKKKEKKRESETEAREWRARLQGVSCSQSGSCTQTLLKHLNGPAEAK